MPRHSLSYSRPENALAFVTLSFFCVAAEFNWLGAVGTWLTRYLHTAFGHASWLIPAWLGHASWRALVGARWSIKHGLDSAFGLLLACTSFALCETQGGWVGLQSASVLRDTIGIGAYVIAAGVWIVVCMRALGTERVQRLLEHISEFADRALEQVRPMIRFPDRSLQPALVGRAVPPSPPALAAAPPTVVRALPPVTNAAPVLSDAPSTAAAAPPKGPSNWMLPKTSLLRAAMVRSPDMKFLAAVARNIEERFASFQIEATVEPSKVQGALLYRLEVTPGPSQSFAPIVARRDDLDAAYAGLGFVQMPGTGKLGIELPIPEAHRGQINIREIVDSKAWATTTAALPLALGATASGDPVVIDLAKSPHLLVAGTTGSGKSVGINLMLASLLLHNSPDEMKLVLIDPKLVELYAYNSLPHLLVPTITENDEAIKRLQWACLEMDKRYKRFLSKRAKNIGEYNAVSSERMARLVFFIDEYADLCSASKSAKAAVEAALARLAQKSRAAGIHVVLATQRPSTDVVTGAIKANFPSRIAYKVAQLEDSKTILGPGYWDRHKQLIGCGDSLVSVPELSGLTRVHGAYIDAEEVDAICDYWRNQTTAQPPESPATEQTGGQAEHDSDADAALVHEPTSEPETDVAQPAEPEQPVIHQKSREDELYERAVAIAKEKAAISQRDIESGLNCNIQTARRVFDRLKQAGLIKSGGPNNKHVYVEPN